MEFAYGSIFEQVGTGLLGLYLLPQEKEPMFIFGLIGGAEMGF